MSQIEICENHTGKMEGLKSISTAVTVNPFCQANQQKNGSICQKCYAQMMLNKMYKALDEKCKRNTALLTSRVLEDYELPDLSKEKYFRFESFGDLNNAIQLQNYVNIAKRNPNTMFALWTKQYQLAYAFFTKYDVPDNFTLILSSLMVNQKISIDNFKQLVKPSGFGYNFKPGQLKVFTVYDENYISKNPKAVNINCGSKLCMGCLQCYNQTNNEEINEVVKSEQSDVYRLLEQYDSRFIKESVSVLDDLNNL